MPRPEAFRGEVWDVWFPTRRVHPAVILSINALNRVLGHVAVIPITGTPGPELTHVPLNADAGLTGYAESYAEITDLEPAARGSLRRRRGLLAPTELARLEAQVRIYLRLRPATASLTAGASRRRRARARGRTSRRRRRPPAARHQPGSAPRHRQ